MPVYFNPPGFIDDYGTISAAGSEIEPEGGELANIGAGGAG